ncbi:hypothetical protein AB3S75_004852 [Citrus x aurantiifolia]
MEWENKKRGREEEEKEKFVKRSAAKKEERSGHVEVEADQSSHISSSSDKYLGLGVFDFPWLHDDDDGGIISKSDQDWNLFQDTFSSLLHDIEFTTHCNLFETTDAAANTPPTTTTTTTMKINTNTNININIPDEEEEEEEEDDDDDDLEIGNVDGSIWSSMFNQPLQHPHTLD